MNAPIRIFAGMLLALGLAACHHPASPSQANATQARELKLYSVPPQQGTALQRALQETVMDGKGSMVTQPFPGKLLVAAPTAEQDSIHAAITALSKASASAVHPDQYSVHFWLIDMLPGNGAESQALQPLSATLATLRKHFGPSHFVLADTAMATTTAGNASNKLDTANRHDFEFWIPATSQGHVQLALRYIDQSADGFRELKTTASMPLGDYVVLAQAAAPRELPNHRKAPPSGAMRLLVVRVDKLAAHAD